MTTAKQALESETVTIDIDGVGYVFPKLKPIADTVPSSITRKSRPSYKGADKMSADEIIWYCLEKAFEPENPIWEVLDNKSGEEIGQLVMQWGGLEAGK